MKYFSHIKGAFALIKSGNRPRWSFDEKTGFDLCGDETRHLEIATVCYYSCPVLFFLLISLAKTKSLSRNETHGDREMKRAAIGKWHGSEGTEFPFQEYSEHPLLLCSPARLHQKNLAARIDEINQWQTALCIPCCQTQKLRRYLFHQSDPWNIPEHPLQCHNLLLVQFLF